MKKPRPLPFCRRWKPRSKAWMAGPPDGLGVRVWIAHPGAEVERHGLAPERLRAEVEFRLARAGVPLCEAGPTDARLGPPCLGVILHVRPEPTAATWPFSLEVFYVEGHGPEAATPGPALHLNWCREAIGQVTLAGRGLDWTPVYDGVARLLEEFLQNYRLSRPFPALPRLVH